MSLNQGTALSVLPTPSEVKVRIAGNEQVTSATLNLIQAHLERYEQVETDLAILLEEANRLNSRRSMRQTIKDFLQGERPNQVTARGLALEGQEISQEADFLRLALKQAGYGEIEERTQVHYDDIKHLTLLDISGDPEAEVFHQRSINSISRLRGAQREIESVPRGLMKMVLLEEIVGEWL